jgi:hypothetical protein
LILLPLLLKSIGAQQNFPTFLRRFFVNFPMNESKRHHQGLNLHPSGLYPSTLPLCLCLIYFLV